MFADFWKSFHLLIVLQAYRDLKHIIILPIFCSLFALSLWIILTQLLTWIKINKYIVNRSKHIYNYANILKIKNSYMFHVYTRRCVLSHFSHVRVFATLWTIAHSATLFLGFSRHEYWTGLLFFLQGIFPTKGWNPYLLSYLHWQEGFVCVCVCVCVCFITSATWWSSLSKHSAPKGTNINYDNHRTSWGPSGSKTKLEVSLEHTSTLSQ